MEKICNIRRICIRAICKQVCIYVCHVLAYRYNIFYGLLKSQCYRNNFLVNGLVPSISQRYGSYFAMTDRRVRSRNLRQLLLVASFDRFKLCNHRSFL